ncbi:hypothetical protein [Devosia sp. 63-57]|uniref:hypothetical protein n=1 Tax=Devosia sp. 63-57 TaxID=1895751 RepID=UPI00086A3F57|nr:hypothetical protein [Devosia sp. 63-57]ODT50262.1 MAG: hypothetical protein ABS74_04920 [Pelagibacterium sp. SCN 63-126]ODU83013.1 MAG: hypothetical protein ABT14_16145 [Pelagibacterium sp. SCN 63-17]OJX45006.1 MAG: hypothetical protein BGO80_03920 [Devosia sp. 63-57]
MKRVEIAVGFTGYPNGKRRHFAKGETPILADAYADLVVGKGHGAIRPEQQNEPAEGAGEKDTSHENEQPQD